MYIPFRIDYVRHYLHMGNTTQSVKCAYIVGNAFYMYVRTIRGVLCKRFPNMG